MHKEILNKGQLELFPFLKKVSKDFGLVGGTAIALHIGHRESIDFDLFSYEEFNNQVIKRRIKDVIQIKKTIVNKKGEFTFLSSNDVKITFFNYPFKIEYKERLDKVMYFADLLTLAAMKAYAIGQRAKWKDYVDLYFIIRDFYSIEDIKKKGREIFGDEFNEKIFRTQLSYFADVSYSEKVEYSDGFAVEDKEIMKKLIEFSLEY